MEGSMSFDFKLRGGLWDKEQRRMLAVGDSSGVFKTDDIELARRFKARGIEQIGGDEVSEVKADPEDLQPVQKVAEPVIVKTEKPEKPASGKKGGAK
jgi:hypothetical protein